MNNYNISQLLLQSRYTDTSPKFSGLTQSTFILKHTGLQVAWSSAFLVGAQLGNCFWRQENLASNCVLDLGLIFVFLLGPGLCGSCSFHGNSTGNKLDHVNTFKISVYMLSVHSLLAKVYLKAMPKGSMYTPLKEQENVSAYLLINTPI